MTVALPREREPQWLLAGKSELGLATMLLALGAFVLVETSRIEVPANANSIGPRFFPTLVGCLLCLVGAWLVVDVLRGGHGAMEAAEDIDLSRSSDWRTLALLSGVFLGHAALLQTLGFAVAGSLLFFGVGATLGSRRWARDIAVSVVLATAVYVLFGRLLGVGLPAGLLEGIL
ncbi:MAG TPA: tripartite tricarboxylate transporter TctB family protein [Mycobacteriales bacterium]|nr:tripartite tricarboxylate transporter TctB family protein [Mycobacteriales bacterium]